MLIRHQVSIDLASKICQFEIVTLYKLPCSVNAVEHADGVWSSATASSDDRGASFDVLFDALNVDCIMLDMVVLLLANCVLTSRRWDPVANVSIGSYSLLFRNNTPEVLDLSSHRFRIDAVEPDKSRIFEIIIVSLPSFVSLLLLF